MASKFDVKDSVFGAFDGTTSVLGIILTVGLTHSHALLLAAVGLAISSAVGMAGGEWLSDNGKSRTAAITIGIATAVGTLLPVLPFILLSGTTAIICGLLVLLAVGAGIAVVRGNTVRTWVQTFLILGIAAGASGLAAIVLGGGG